ncbi:hypothetical protein ABKV19_010060 [Rosa sericea]
MELRSRKRLSGADSDGIEQRVEDGNSESSGSSDEEIYLPISSDSSAASDSEGEDNQQNEEVTINLNDRPKGKLKEPLRKKGKVEQKKKREQPSSEEEVADYGSFDELQLTPQKAVEIDFLGLTRRIKKKRSRSGGQKPILMWNVWEDEHDKWINENLSEDFDLDIQNNVVNEVAETPSDLIMPLLRYQKEWLAWALRQEESETRGGILADEMGMGKTIQAIALVLAKREINWTVYEPGSSTGLPHIKGTLVVCPVVAVSQWVSEIERFTSKGSTKILVYHGANREKSSKQFLEYDFVITTYSIVEADYRKHVMPPKEKCPYCGKLFYETKMSIHLKYFCGPNAIRTEKQSKQQRKKHLPSKKPCESSKEKISGSSGTKKGAHRKGSKLQKDDDMDSEDVVRDMNKKNSVLHAVKWNRIILDEAHYIKSRRCNTAKAVLALESTYKWALSGTPLQNRVGELYSLVRFLQLVPYSYYLCKDCDCRTLDHSSTPQCSNCPHSSVRHFCWWNKILKNIVLRRTKKGRAADLALPPRIVSLRKDTLDIKEQDYYESLYTDSQALFNTYVDAGTLMNNYAHIFDLLTRLRQAVDHPYLVVYSATAALRNGNKANIDNTEKVCGICHDPAEDQVVTACEHVFCKACLIDFSASLGQVSCPSCSKLLTVDLTTSVGAGNQTTKTTIKGFRSSSILNRIQLENFQTSTKIEALKEEIRFMVERDGSAKGIVFSQFTSFLDLIHYSLQKSGVNCVQLVGSMTMSARDTAIKRFTEDPDCRIFLMSLKAGGVALNLTVASHVFLMDPWWNPAVERQAQDRIHRIGQYKPIRIVRFVIENTIEERILKLQEKKELVFEGTIGGSSEALGKLTEADLKFLFVT